MIAYFAEKRKDAPPGENGRRVPIGGKGGKIKGKFQFVGSYLMRGMGDVYLAKRLTTPTTTSSAASAANTRFSAISSASFLVSSLTCLQCITACPKCKTHHFHRFDEKKFAVAGARW